jgi:hypothetical protein
VSQELAINHTLRLIIHVAIPIVEIGHGTEVTGAALETSRSRQKKTF